MNSRQLIPLLLLTLTLINGCTTTTAPQQNQHKDVFSTLEQGDKAFNLWRQNKDYSRLLEAEKLYSYASKNLPDNIKLQKTYYSTLYMLTSEDWLTWHKKLENHFEAINPLLKPDLSPPSLLTYFYLVDHNAPQEQLISSLKNALKEQPGSFRPWYFLSLIQQEKKQFHLALHSALRAIDIEKNIPELAYHVGEIYDDIARNESCLYQHPELSRNAIKYITKAVAAQPNDQKYQIVLASLYSRIGLYPIALQVALKAQALEDNQWASEQLGEAYLDMQRYTEADAEFQRLYDKYQQQYANGLRAVIAVSHNQWQEADNFFKKINYQEDDFYSLSVKNWINAVSQNKKDIRVDSLLNTQDKWLLIIKDYFNQQDNSAWLIEQASNSCEKTEAYFYTAMKKWSAGDLAGSKQNLKSVISLKSYAYNEYIWARALLKSDLFDHKKHN